MEEKDDCYDIRDVIKKDKNKLHKIVMVKNIEKKKKKKIGEIFIIKNKDNSY
tara:strand:- start:978 stop:1133 length:156 start_codon:yes stop_codon:yes gene_type:complete